MKKTIFLFIICLFFMSFAFFQKKVELGQAEGELQPEFSTSLPILTRGENLLLKVSSSTKCYIDSYVLSGIALVSVEKKLLQKGSGPEKVILAPNTEITRRIRVPIDWFKVPPVKASLLLPSVVIRWESPCLKTEYKEFLYLDVDLNSARVRLETNMGNMEFVFEPEKAPDHVKNFLRLVKSGFYDGTQFHRVIKGFMIQGGDPNTKDDNPLNDGKGGAPWKINAEFNCLPHVYGALSMARDMRYPDSASSQFFIVVSKKEQTHLNCKFTVFGKLISGEETLDKIANVETTGWENSRPKNPVIIKKAVVFYPE